MKAPELDAGLQVGSHQSGVGGQNHLPWPAGHAAFDAAQDTAGHLGCERTLPDHVEPLFNQHSQVLLLRAALSTLSTCSFCFRLSFSCCFLCSSSFLIQSFYKVPWCHSSYMFSMQLLHNHLVLWGWVLPPGLSEKGLGCDPPGANPWPWGSQHFPSMSALPCWGGKVNLAVPATSKESLESSPCLPSGLSTYRRIEHKWAILNSQISPGQLIECI